MRINSSIRTCRNQPYAIIVILFTALAATFFTGCSQKREITENTKTGGVLYFGIEVPFHGFDILETSTLNPPTAPLNNLIQEPLFRMDRSGNLISIEPEEKENQSPTKFVRLKFILRAEQKSWFHQWQTNWKAPGKKAISRVSSPLNEMGNLIPL